MVKGGLVHYNNVHVFCLIVELFISDSSKIFSAFVTFGSGVFGCNYFL